MIIMIIIKHLMLYVIIIALYFILIERSEVKLRLF